MSEGRRNVIKAIPKLPAMPCKSSKTSPPLAKNIAATNVCVPKNNVRKNKRNVNEFTFKYWCLFVNQSVGSKPRRISIREHNATLQKNTA